MTRTGETLGAVRPLVIRRNAAQRMAGLGYSAITAAWLWAVLAHFGARALPGELLLFAMSLSGLVYSLLRDDVIVDGSSLKTCSGFPILGQTSEMDLALFDRLTIRSESGEEVDEGSVRPVPRAWFSLLLEGEGGQELRLLWFDSEDSPSARRRAMAPIEARARVLSNQIGLPLV